MPTTKMAFAPTDGLRNAATYPTTPANETAAREQIQGRLDEIKNYLNNTLTVEFDTHLSDLTTDADGVHGLKIEEGPWTPTLVGSTTLGVHTYAIQVGRYYKIGKLVHVRGRIQLSAKDVVMAGDMWINGLPFASANVADAYSVGTVGYHANFTGLTGYGIVLNLNPNSTQLALNNNMQNGINAIAAANITNSTDLLFSCSYVSA